MSISANFKKILRDYNYLYESLTDVKEISSIAEGEFRQAMIDSGDKEALQALVPNESQQTKLNEIKQEEQEKEPTHNDVDFKKLFRKIVIKCHPDKNRDANEKQLEFLKECYENATLANNVYDWGLLLRVASQLDVDLSDIDEKQMQNIKLKNEELQKINAELDHFVYSISHDLRSPLLSIKGIVSLVLKSPELKAENVKLLNMTLNSAGRLDNTIQEILEYSRNSRMDIAYASFDIAELIENVFDDLTKT